MENASVQTSRSFKTSGKRASTSTVSSDLDVKLSVIAAVNPYSERKGSKECGILWRLVVQRLVDIGVQLQGTSKTCLEDGLRAAANRAVVAFKEKYPSCEPDGEAPADMTDRDRSSWKIMKFQMEQAKLTLNSAEDTDTAFPSLANVSVDLIHAYLPQSEGQTEDPDVTGQILQGNLKFAEAGFPPATAVPPGRKGHKAAHHFSRLESGEDSADEFEDYGSPNRQNSHGTERVVVALMDIASALRESTRMMAQEKEKDRAVEVTQRELDRTAALERHRLSLEAQTAQHKMLLEVLCKK